MRRREKFVIASFLCTLGLLAVQYTSLDFRYLSLAVFVLFTYIVSTWALSDDLQSHERLTIIPFPSLYGASVSLFYFLLPQSVLSQIIVLVMFGVGMYALYLTANIFSVAKGRNIQLVHAAHAVSLLFGVLISLLVSNTIFSLKLPFFLNGLLTGLVHFPLSLMLLWSIKLDGGVDKEVLGFTGVLTLLLVELAVVLSFFPLALWYNALFIMSFFYVSIGLLQNYMRGRLFFRTLVEYSLVAGFIGFVFFVIFPWK